VIAAVAVQEQQRGILLVRRMVGRQEDGVALGFVEGGGEKAIDLSLRLKIREDEESGDNDSCCHIEETNCAARATTTASDKI
jgi:hypothetical protein